MTFLSRVKKTIDQQRLIRPGDCILIGVSGGADSVALLEILCTLRQEWGLKLSVAHIHHGLRRSADRDQIFVEKLCAKKGLPCKSARITIPKVPKDSLEQIAREKRFAALIKIAEKIKADSIALGHHQNDLAETVLMRIIRGAGLQGLQAILPKRTINGTTVIRPLIQEPRTAIEKFLQENTLRCRNDPTNTNKKFLRNKVRHTLLNCLAAKYNPNIREALARLAETSSLDYELLSQFGDEAFKKVVLHKTKKRVALNLTKLKKYHQSLQRMIMRKAIEALQGHSRRITLQHIHLIETLLLNSSNQQTVQLPSNIVVRTLQKTSTHKTSSCLFFEKI